MKKVTLYLFIIPFLVGLAGLAIAQTAEELIAAAKKEGKLVVYTGGHTRDEITLVVKRFEEKYGIKVEVTRKPTGPIMSLIEAERQAGAVKADVVGLAIPTAFLSLRDKGLLAPYQPPNLSEIKAELRDPDGYYTPFTFAPLGFAYHTRLAKEGTLPKSWKEIGDPKWKGKLVHANPDTSGTAASFVNGMVKLEGWDFYKKMGANRPLIVESGLAITPMILTGEALIGLPGPEQSVLSAKAKGEPIDMYFPAEGVPVAIYSIGLLKDAPHPNAGKLFINFHLSEEMQRGLTEIRSHTVLEKLPPPKGAVPLAGLKLIVPDWGWLLKNVKAQNQEFHKLVKP